MGLFEQNADKDREARTSLWSAIRVASVEVQDRFRIRNILGGIGTSIHSSSAVPDIATWQLVEAISMLGVILRSEDAFAHQIHLFGKTGPIEIKEDGIMRYLWAQQNVKGDRTELVGRPDLIVTSSPESPHSGNAIRIIESKCVRQLQTPTIRAEFGKGYDLQVGSYLIWSFYTQSSRVVSGAKGLGIDLEFLGFDTKHRPELIAYPGVLINRVSSAQEATRNTHRFARALNDSARLAIQKVSPPSKWEEK